MKHHKIYLFFLQRIHLSNNTLSCTFAILLTPTHGTDNALCILFIKNIRVYNTSRCFYVTDISIEKIKNKKEKLNDFHFLYFDFLCTYVCITGKRHEALLRLFDFF